MLSVQDPAILSLVPDYRTNLFSPAEIKDEELNKLQSNLRETYAYSQEKLQHDTDQIIGSRHPSPEDRDTHNMQNASDHSCYRDLDQLIFYFLFYIYNLSNLFLSPNCVSAARVIIFESQYVWIILRRFRGKRP